MKVFLGRVNFLNLPCDMTWGKGVGEKERERERETWMRDREGGERQREKETWTNRDRMQMWKMNFDCTWSCVCVCVFIKRVCGWVNYLLRNQVLQRWWQLMVAHSTCESRENGVLKINFIHVNSDMSFSCFYHTAIYSRGAVHWAGFPNACFG